MPDPQHPEATEAAEAVLDYVDDTLLPTTQERVARIIAEKCKLAERNAAMVRLGAMLNLPNECPKCGTSIAPGCDVIITPGGEVMCPKCARYYAAPAMEAAFKEGCEESKCPASSGHAEHAWLHSAARVALGEVGGG